MENEGTSDPQPEIGSIRALAIELAELRFDRYLLDTAVVDQAAKDLTKWLRDETGVQLIPTAVIRLGLRVLAAVLMSHINNGAGAALTWTLQTVVGAFERLPGSKIFCQTLQKWIKNKARDTQAKNQLQELISGDRSSIDPELLQTLSLDLQLHLRQAADASALDATVRAEFDRILEILNPQPQLDPKHVALTGEGRLRFGARNVPFVGRDVELKELRSFVDADGDMQWWLVTGPGGMGKSRLALEFCHQVGACWRAGFLSNMEVADFHWNTWQPNLPHLLVVDYAGLHPREVGKMLNALRLREFNNPLEARVRILLLERHRGARWWNRLLNESPSRSLESMLYKGQSYNLGPIGRDASWKIIERVAGDRARQLGFDNVIASLEMIDPATRPLFAALAGEALDAGVDLGQWNSTRLLGSWLQRERERFWEWQRVDEPHANLAALATLLGGVGSDVLETAPNGIELPTSEGVNPAAFAAITGRQPADGDDGSTNFAPFEPDILGTYFVLEHLRDPLGRGLGTPRAARNRARRYASAAWSRDEPQLSRFVEFLVRAGDDFLEHEMFSALLAPPDKDPGRRTLWSSVLHDLVLLLGNSNRQAESTELLKLLKQTAENYPDEVDLLVTWAQASVNFIADCDGMENLHVAMSVLQEIDEFQQRSPVGPHLRVHFARGSVNVLVLLGRCGAIDDAIIQLDRLRDISIKNAEEAELRLEYAKGIFNLINALHRNERHSEALVLYGQLRELATAHPHEIELRLRQARSGVNLIAFLWRVGRLDQAEELHVSLRNLAAKHVDEPALRLELANGHCNLINGYLAEDRLNDAVALLASMRELVAANPREAGLIEWAGRATIGALSQLVSANRNDEAQGLARSSAAVLRHQRVLADLPNWTGERASDFKALIDRLLDDP